MALAGKLVAGAQSRPSFPFVPLAGGAPPLRAITVSNSLPAGHRSQCLYHQLLSQEIPNDRRAAIVVEEGGCDIQSASQILLSAQPTHLVGIVLQDLQVKQEYGPHRHFLRAKDIKILPFADCIGEERCC